MYTIYCYTNKTNGKKYVGLTKSPTVRHIHHKSPHKTNSTQFANAIRKYGIENFVYEHIETNIKTLKEAKQLEIQYIAEYNSYKKGYNSTPGGDMGGPNTKLTETQVIDILTSPVPAIVMVEKYNIDKGNVYQIRTGRTWSHLSHLKLDSYPKGTGKTEKARKRYK